MARNRDIAIVSPLAGVHEAFARQNQPPYTTPDALNVRPRDTFDTRLRVGRRPGLRRATGTALTAPLYGLLGVGAIPADTLRVWEDEFRGDKLSTAWLQMWDSLAGGGSGAVMPFPEVRGGTARIEGATFQGAGLQNFDRLDAAKVHSLSVLVDLREGFDGQSIRLMGRLNTSGRPTITPTNTVWAFFSLADTAGDLVITYKIEVNGVSTGSSGTYTIPAAQIQDEYWLSLELCSQSLNTYVSQRVNGRELTSRTDLTSATAGTRFAFEGSTSADPIVLAAARFTYHESSSGSGTVSQIVAVDSTGVPKLLDNSSTPSLVATATRSPANMQINAVAGSRIRMQQRDGIVFICENDSVVHEGSDGRIIQLGGGVNTAGLHANSAFSSANVDQHVAEVFDVQGFDLGGAWPFTAINASPIYLKLDEKYAQIEFPNTTSCSYRVRRPNKYLDLRNNVVYRWLAAPGKGTVPMGCHSIGVYNDRMVLADSNAVYMSRAGDPFDWDYFAGLTEADGSRAQIITLSESGAYNDKPAAFWKWGDQRAIIAGRRSLFVLTGDPGVGGYVYAMEESGGCLGPDAWCQAPDGTTFFLGREGLMRLTADARGFPEMVSRSRVPEDFRASFAGKWANPGPQMAYDVEHGGILILPFLDATSGTATDEISCWWVDTDNYGFWPHTIRYAQWPRVLNTFVEFPLGVTFGVASSRVLLGSDDGHIRHFKSDVAGDERPTGSGSYDVTNRVVLGPIALGDGGTLQGTLEFIQSEMRVSGGTLTYEIRVGETPQQALAASAAASGTLSDYLSTVKPVERSGKWAYITLTGGTGCRWAMERIDARIRQQGYTSTK